MTKKILFFDMDNVLVNFQSGIDRLDEATKQAYEGHIDDVPGIFALMDPIEGAKEAVEILAKKYDVYILSTAPWKNPTACNDKLAWVKKHFDVDGDEKKNFFYKRLILTHHKNLCHGDYLIDDRPHKCGADKFTGEVIHFGSERFPDWDAVVEYLMAT
jgi:5'(3')-deoxyribonucleotidase